MSYHNGSVWPHDNAIVAAGLARYGFTARGGAHLRRDVRSEPGRRSASAAGADLRLPPAQRATHPTLYPVACAPQAWAAGAVYLLVQACLGLRVDAARTARVVFARRSCRKKSTGCASSTSSVGSASVDLLLTRHAYDVGVTVLRREGKLEIIESK